MMPSLDFVDWKSDLLARVDRGLKIGTNLGATSLELYISRTHSLNIAMKSGMIDATQGGVIGVGCRALIGKKIGFASASGITDSTVNFVIQSAIDVAKTLPEEDARWDSFVQTPETGKEGIIDTTVLEITPEEVVNAANNVYREAKAYDARVKSVDGEVYVSYGAFAIGNTEGVVKASSTTEGFGYAYTTVGENDKSKTGFDYVMGRGVPEMEGIGTSSAEKAIKLLESVPINHTGELNVVFNNLAAGMVIQTALSSSINGKSIVEGRSAFRDRVGDQVGVPYLTIYDDGQIPEDPAMHKIDHEGFPRRTTPIIEQGVLKNFIFDQYYSKIFETESTGNASRGTPQSYESLPTVSPTTISVVPGSKNLDELAAEIENGLLASDFLMGVGHANLISGDFSIVAPSCHKIKNGEITHPIDPVTIAGNFYQAFAQICALGNETELTFFGKIPSIAFEGFTVSG